MSTPSSAMPTRQQLEEIDALLKRMLSLPPLASEAAEPPPSTPPVSPYAQPTIREVPPATPPVAGEPIVQAWRVEWPTSPAPTTVQTPPPSPVPVTTPVASSLTSWGTPVGTVATLPPPPIETPRFTMYQPQSTPVAVAAPVALTPAAPVLPTPIPATVPTSLYGIPASVPVETARPAWLLPFVVVNGLYDFLTYVLGPFGPWLRDSGRRWLGWLGALMILGSLVWLTGNWLGYDWPAIPWQKLELSRFGWTK